MVTADLRRQVGRNRALRLFYVSQAGGGADTYVRTVGRTLADRGHEVTVLYMSESSKRTTSTEWDGAVRLEHIPFPNGHWLYHRALSMAPRKVGQLFPEPPVIKAGEAALAVRHVLARLQRRMGRFDLVEVFEEFGWPALLRGSIAYSVKLHSSEGTWRDTCGDGIRAVDRRRFSIEATLL